MSSSDATFAIAHAAIAGLPRPYTAAELAEIRAIEHACFRAMMTLANATAMSLRSTLHLGVCHSSFGNETAAPGKPEAGAEVPPSGQAVAFPSGQADGPYRT